MRPAMLTPLFPPDTSDSAVYAKLLATKLADLSLTVLAYGRLPESVAGVEIVSIDKSGFKVLTVLRCLLTLHRTQPTTLLLHNGPSTDVPALLYKLLHPAMPLVYIESDTDVTARGASWFNRLVNQWLTRRAATVVTLPTDRALYLPTEILPFTPIDTDTEHKKAAWWSEHVHMLQTYVR